LAISIATPARCALALVSKVHLPPPHRHLEFEHLIAGMIVILYKCRHKKKVTDLVTLLVWLMVISKRPHRVIVFGGPIFNLFGHLFDESVIEPAIWNVSYWLHSVVIANPNFFVLSYARYGRKVSKCAHSENLLVFHDVLVFDYGTNVHFYL